MPAWFFFGCIISCRILRTGGISALLLLSSDHGRLLGSLSRLGIPWLFFEPCSVFMATVVHNLFADDLACHVTLMLILIADIIFAGLFPLTTPQWAILSEQLETVHSS